MAAPDGKEKEHRYRILLSLGVVALISGMTVGTLAFLGLVHFYHTVLL